MKYLAFLIFILFGQSAYADSFAMDVAKEWERLPSDKRAHLEIEGKIGFASSGFLFLLPLTEDDRRKLPPWKLATGASAFCLSIGVGKELFDEYDHRIAYYPGTPGSDHQPRSSHGADPMDLVADVAGCAAGVTLGAWLGTTTRLLFYPHVGSDELTVGVAVRF